MGLDLTALGLSTDESAFYLLLLDRQAASSATLAEEWAPERESVGSLLRSLQVKGLVTTLAGLPVRHAAIAPDVALDNLARVREQQITAARAHVHELTERWRRVGRATIPAELIEIIVGREATSQRSEQIQRSATEEVLIIDAPPYAGPAVENPHELEVLPAGTVRYRCLYDRSSLEVPGKLASINRLTAIGEEARVAADLPMKLVMGDQAVAMVSLESAPASITAALVVHPSALLNSLRLLFEATWRSAFPMRNAEDARQQLGTLDSTSRELTELENQIIPLLVTGMTDQAIGRQLGLAERTIQRKVRTIMTSLGVTNRLQLGLRLAQQGWGP
ncbi:helix-turn-helix transcriptional regulator [Ornithinimicrobium cavernae]|uniref:helix-turn-helix transcriptional regulator n=1 Tax=Ornithinimicrobium cavernae TaxID=2666047 RepID=UPI000D6927FE|nr:LuxR C-terminal-related transcriptional regulator [Ornithinimicrobium cavernae]